MARASGMGAAAAGIAVLLYGPLAHMIGDPAAAVSLAALTIGIGIGTAIWLVSLKSTPRAIEAEDLL